MKFFISENEYRVLSRKLKEILPVDVHSKEGKGYFIRSLYFDTVEDKAFWEKEAGTMYRKKYRLRTYDLDAKKVKFEIKNKINNQIFKETAWISREDALEVQEGNYGVLLKYKNKVLNKIYYEFKKERYMPVVMVDYVREPFVLPFNNIRVTFDKFLQSNISCFNIFKKDLLLKSILRQGVVVLEIKYDGFIPDWLKKVLQISRFERSAISKYCNSRLERELVYFGV